MTGNNTASEGTCSRKQKGSSLPRSRSNLTNNIFYACSILCLFVSLLVCRKKDDFSYINALRVIIIFPMFMAVLFEVFCRALYMIEEHKYLITRYDNSYKTLIKDIFNFPKLTYLFMLFPLFSFIFLDHFNVLWEWYDLGPYAIFFSFLSIYFLRRNHSLECGTLYDSLSIEHSNGLDYGSGMAHSFFHGYLKLVIPKTGTTVKHLEELMRDYEDEHQVKLEFYKLFILIPKSLYCPSTLMNADISPSIEESRSLKEKIITVAGVQNRVYKNSVYKIKGKHGKKMYVCAEYATPLKTFNDVVYVNGEHAKYYLKHKNDIVLQFYLTLKKILKEHENCTNFCELIFYDDKNEGQNKDVGQVLMQRIHKLKKRAL